ncbi:GTPase-associated system all-helical protein GASH [Mesorhizobium sp. M0140]|uniref:GTPase-associated system all-helical protein GASH n=1 Tax=Mesorhizobium sp. M0140 TaxID=2956893 RepID=UPI003335A39D
MLDIAPHVRIFEASPSDEFVKKRQAAIKEIAGKFFKPNYIARLLSVANGVVIASGGGKLPPDLASDVATSITKVSPSFVAEGHDLELATCAMLAAITAIQTGNKSGALTAADYIAVGIWSGMSWQPGSSNERFEKLRKFLLALSRDHVLKAAAVGRTRSQPAGAVALATDNGNLGKVVENLRSVVDTLITNAAVDREEIDLLWWSISGWSDVLEMKYADAKPTAAAIALGLDAAKRLRRMPVELHKALVIRRVPEGESVSLAQLVKTLGDDRAALGASFGSKPLVTENTQVFPLLNVLASGYTKGVGKGAFSLPDLALRALLEAVTFDVLERREV